MPSWKKVITSGSDASLNSLNITSNLTVSGSSFLGDSLSDSSAFTGSVSITGSLALKGPLYDNLDSTGTTDQILLRSVGGIEWRDNLSTGVELSQSIVTNVNVGGLNSGTSLTSGTDIESILRQILITYIAPTLGTVSLKNNSTTVLSSNLVYEVSSSLTFNTASFTATADNPNGRFAYSASFTASGADTGNFNYYFGDNVLSSNNNLGLGSSRIINVDSVSGNSQIVTFSIRGVNPQSGAIISGTSRTLTYVYPFFHGMTSIDYSSSGNLSDLVSGITKSIEVKGTKTKSISGTNAYVYFAYPAAYGSLTSIKDGNNFEILSSFTLYTRNQNGDSSNPWTNISYNIYKNNNLTTVSPAQNYIFTF